MNTSQLDVLRKLKEDFPFYARKCLKIIDKTTGQIKPFELNRAQSYIHARLEEQKRKTGWVRAVIVKGRQQGCSTYVAGRYFHASTLNPGSTVFVLSHMSDSTDHLFGMSKRFYETAPPPILPTASKMNERKLEFDKINSSYKVGTAGSAQIGRSTTIRFFHGSEVAFWENSGELASGVLQAVPKAPGTEIILESTCNGSGDWFHKKAMAGLGEDGDFITIFTPWFWQPEYYREPPKDFALTDEEEVIKRTFSLSDGQLFFRRRIIEDEFDGDVWRFKREYPNTVEEGFLASGESLIKPVLVIDARKCKVQDPFATPVGGCDPARNRDRTVMAIRRGREILSLKKYNTMDEMTCAGIIADEIERYGIQKYFIDVGCGYGAVDRLKELGFGGIVTGVHFGATAMQSDIYANKGSEMADAVKAWFEDGGANIPDLDELQADLVAIPPLKSIGSRGRLGLPPKDEIKKVLGRSPDFFDALRLTFAFPVASRVSSSRIKRAVADPRRPNSPLGTVRDFNRAKRNQPQIFQTNVKII